MTVPPRNVGADVANESDGNGVPTSKTGNAVGTTFEQIFPGVDLASETSDPEVPFAERRQGQVEVLSTDFAIGWAAVGRDDAYSHVIASLEGKVLGSSRADMFREDLEAARLVHSINGRAFVVAFYDPVPPADLERVSIRVLETGLALRTAAKVKIESRTNTRIFLLGSPRSGTSQLGATLAACLSLAWTGEAHAAPRFAAAAEQLGGDPTSPNEFVRSLAAWNFRRLAIDAARRGYFFIHSSSSFLDKTPGVAMVRAAPFIAECFPDAKFVFIRRHPISNIVSRMARFGGDFEEHCNDWATTMHEWMRVRPLLPNYLDLEQEEMASAPDHVATRLAQFLGRPDLLGQLSASLSSGFLEKTGAGTNCVTLSQTNWTSEQKARFTSICDVTMRAFGYYADSG
jgi:hypothetical protein